MALPQRGGEAGIAVQRIARLVDRQRHDVELDVGAAALRILACRPRRRPVRRRRSAGRGRATSQSQPMRAKAQRIAHVVVERVARLQANDGARLVVVLQVLADARAGRRRLRCRAARSRPAGPMPESCRSCGDCRAPADRITSRSARADCLLPSADPFDADGARAFERDARCVRARDHRQIGPRHRRAQERDRRALAPALADAQLVGADAVGGLAVEVAVGRQAELLRRLDPGAAGRMVVAQGRDTQRRRARRDTGWARRRSARACGSTGARRDSPSPWRRPAPSRRSPRAGRG